MPKTKMRMCYETKVWNYLNWYCSSEDISVHRCTLFCNALLQMGIKEKECLFVEKGSLRAGYQPLQAPNL